MAPSAGDLKMPGMLVAGLVRSPHPHARIVGIDVEDARRVPGVRAVLTCHDIPGSNRVGILVRDQAVLAEEKVRYIGEPVATLAAEDEEALELGLKAVRVDYEPLPAVLSVEEAMAPDAPQVHEGGNLLTEARIVRGDVDRGLAEADAVVEGIYRTSYIEHAYLEPEAGIARWEPDGSLTLWVSTQNPHYDRAEVAAVMAMPVNRVRVIATVTGGGFGGKLDVSVQPYIALLSAATKRPVKMVFSREESICYTTKRHPYTMRYRLGARSDGRFTALEAELVADGGAYASYSPGVIKRAAIHAGGPYYYPNVRVVAKVFCTNNPIAGAMRGFSVPQIAFGCESQIDKLARVLSIDPLHLRLINALDRGMPTLTGQVLNASVGIKRTILEAARAAGWPLEVPVGGGEA
jgi:CO/xanthine dehydrogenase Mo-binding subunit